MDPVTHALSGAAVWLACKNRPQTPWGLPLAMMTAASPDIDIFFAATPLEFLYLHRGITHSLFALPLMTLITAFLMDSLWRKTTPGAWPFYKVALLACGLLLAHIWLDCVTTYGTMIFTPVSDFRVRLNGIFIVDFLLVIPLIAAWYFGRKSRAIAMAGVAWFIIYPAAGVAERIWLEHKWRDQIVQAVPGADPESLFVLPDFASPLRWKIIFKTEDKLFQQGLWASGAAAGELENFPLARQATIDELSAEDRSCRAFFKFTILPTQKKLSEDETGSEWLFHDLRFASMEKPVRKVMSWRKDGDVPFQLVVRLDAEGRLKDSRLIFSGADRESDFAPPQKPGQASFWEKLVGIK